MPRKKAKRAPSGAWDTINRVNQIVNTTSASEAARLLGVSRRSVYNLRKVAASKAPARNVIATPKTLKAWNARLNVAATNAVKNQVIAYEKGKKPPRSFKEVSKIVTAGTGEKWSYQKVSSFVRKVAIPKPIKEPPEFIPPDYDEPIRWSIPTTDKKISEMTRADFDAGLTRHFTENGIHYMGAGEEWINDDGTRRANIERRKSWGDKKGLEDYIEEVGLDPEFLAVEILYDANGNEYYQVYLSYIEPQ